MSNGMVNTFTIMGNSQGSNSYRNVNTFYSSGNISITNNLIQSPINRLTSPSVNVNSFYGSNNVGTTQNYSPIVNTFTSTTPNITTQTFTTPMQDRVSTIQTFTRSTPSVTTQTYGTTNTMGLTSGVINVGGGMTGGVMPFSSRNGMMTNQIGSRNVRTLKLTQDQISRGAVAVEIIPNTNGVISVNTFDDYTNSSPINRTEIINTSGFGYNMA